MKPITDAVLLDARQDVASARDKVVRSGLDKVAVRRSEGLVVFWYAFDTQHVFTCLQAHDNRASVKQALDLHERSASPVLEISAIDTTDYVPHIDTVILDGEMFIGVCLAAAEPNTCLLDFDIAPHRNVPSNDLLRRKLRGFRISREDQDRMEGMNDVDLDNFPTQTDSGLPTDSTPAKSSPVAVAETAFTAFPRLDAPVKVAPREQFSITIGLAPQPSPGMSGGPITVDLPSTIDRFALDVLIVTDEFDMPAGGRHLLEVDRENPYAHPISVPLIAPESVDDALLTTISVIYFYEKIPCGTAARKIAVIPANIQPFDDTHGTGMLWTSGGGPDGAVTARPGVPQIDLTVTISKPDGNPTSGQFVWSFVSPHNVTLPALPVPRNLGMDAKEFGTNVIDGIQNSEIQDMVELEIGGLGKDIADRMPAEFWPILRDVAKLVNEKESGSVPTLLFLSAEAHVPWELALMDPPLDAGAPPYLGCQTNMARWPLSDSGTPPLPPAASIDVHNLTVVVGDYAGISRWRELKQAKEECRIIESHHGARKFVAESLQIKQLLTMSDGAMGTEAVHFACHGEAIGGNVLDAAIILGKDQRMSPTWLANAPLGKKCSPFLFLNACQVGKAGELLGSFSGFAGESLKGGFRGFLAPMWSVDDELARDIAVEFYDQVFGYDGSTPKPVASVLRSMRRRFAPDAEKSSATRLAYVFYGHPGLTMLLRKDG